MINSQKHSLYLRKFKLLLDENIPLILVNELRNLGINVKWMTELQRGAPDKKVLQIATEEKRILVTFDKDFGSLIYKERLPIPPGIVLIEFSPSSPQELVEKVREFMENYCNELVGYFIVLEKDRIRRKRLPPSLQD